MADTSTYESFVSLHQNQLEASKIPSHLWPSLHHKLINQVFDAGNAFKIELIEYVEENGQEDDGSKENGCVENGDDHGSDCDGNGNGDDDDDGLEHSYRVIALSSQIDDIYLIDHMWTYYYKNARRDLTSNQVLKHRLMSLMNINLKDVSEDEIVEEVMKEMWKWNHCYSMEHESINGDDKYLPLWYILDEFGSRIQHSLDPSFRCVPFYYVYGGITYSLLFPIKQVMEEEEVTINFLETCIESENDRDNEEIKLLQDALLIPWIACDLSHIDCTQTEPDSLSVRSSMIEESLPQLALQSKEVILRLPRNRNIRVFTEYDYIKQYLTLPMFEMTDSEDNADILWLFRHYKQYHQLSISSPNVFINQFPFEHILTVKDLFAVICRRDNTSSAQDHDQVDPLGVPSGPNWLATTYNLQTELPKFVSYFQRREKLGLDNYWICKPWNLARGLDTLVTNDLNCIIRARNHIPKVVCKYITDPVLFKRDDLNGASVKFDIRYIVLLKSVQPLQLFAYKKFWLRFANKPFSLNNLDDYEKHFTVMNYATDDHVQLKNMYCEQFIDEFNAQYGHQFEWSKVECDIFAAIKSAFKCSVMKPPPGGLCPSSQSRAMYAVDIMLKWSSNPTNHTKSIQPVLLEINYSPDCQRACEYYPHFFNHIFSTLFLKDNDYSECNVIEI